MERLEKAVKQVLRDFAEYLDPKEEGVRQELIFDAKTGITS
jgi:hypothetical protein